MIGCFAALLVLSVTTLGGLGTAGKQTQVSCKRTSCCSLVHATL